MLITVIALVHGIFILSAKKKSILSSQHGLFLLLLGVHFLSLNSLNYFDWQLPFLSGFALLMYGPMMLVKARVLASKTNHAFRSLLYYCGLTVILLVLIAIFGKSNTTLVQYGIHIYLNLFLVVSIFTFKKAPNPPTFLFKWAQAFIGLFLIINSAYMVVMACSQYYPGLYLWAKIPFTLLFILLLLNNIRFFTSKPGFIHQMAAFDGSKNSTLRHDVLRALEQTMKGKRLYLKPDIDLKLLASESGFTERTISEAINSTGSNFYHFVNSFRIDHAIAIMKADTSGHKLIKEIMYASGFGNKGSFINAFKEKFGAPPSTYRAQLLQAPSNNTDKPV